MFDVPGAPKSRASAAVSDRIALRNDGAVHEQLDRAPGQSARGDRVVAVEGLEVELVGGFCVQKVDRWGQAGHVHVAGPAGDGDSVVSVCVVDSDVVGLTVSGRAAGSAKTAKRRSRTVTFVMFVPFRIVNPFAA
jgi:hypothetical protein